MSIYRKQLEELGGYENELIPVPAGGVRVIIDALEAAEQQLAAKDHLLRQALDALNLPCDRWNGVQYKIVRSAAAAIDEELGK